MSMTVFAHNGVSVPREWRAVALWRTGSDGRTRSVWRYVWPLALLTLSACASAPKPWVAPVRVPSELATEVPEPVLADKPDNGDLATWADELRAALREANRRLRAIRGL